MTGLVRRVAAAHHVYAYVPGGVDCQCGDRFVTDEDHATHVAAVTVEHVARLLDREAERPRHSSARFRALRYAARITRIAARQP